MCDTSLTLSGGRCQVYPTLVIRGTGLYELWKHGLYRNYDPRLLVDLVARILALVPPWVRLSCLCCPHRDPGLAGQYARECTGAPGFRGSAWGCFVQLYEPHLGNTVGHFVQGYWLCRRARQQTGACPGTQLKWPPQS